jgi:hypothetical protein
VDGKIDGLAERLDMTRGAGAEIPRARDLRPNSFSTSKALCSGASILNPS